MTENCLFNFITSCQLSANSVTSAVKIYKMAENQQKLIHTFGALAELGNEIAHKQNFQEMIRTSLHLLLGSLAIMRGGVARYSRFGHELNMLARARSGR